MKKDIHPKYNQIEAKCGCGSVFKIWSTLSQSISLDVCSNCHPFYTGKQKFVDTAGRIEKFKKKYQS